MKMLTCNNTIESKLGTIDEAVARYRIGRCSVRKLAEEIGAVVRIGRSYRVNFTIMDKYFDEISGN